MRKKETGTAKGAKVIYHYSVQDNSLSYTTTATPDPMTPGRYLVPANSTDIKPPEVGSNKIPVFIPEKDEWIIQPDFRNCTIYSIEDGTSVLWYKVGSLPKGWTEKEKPNAAHAWDSKKSKWVPSSTAAKASKQQNFLLEFNTKKEEPIEYNGIYYGTRTADLVELNSILTAFSEELPHNFTIADVDGKPQKVLRTDLVEILRLVVTRNSALVGTFYIKKRNLEKA